MNIWFGSIRPFITKINEGTNQTISGQLVGIDLVTAMQ